MSAGYYVPQFSDFLPSETSPIDRLYYKLKDGNNVFRLSPLKPSSQGHPPMPVAHETNYNFSQGGKFIKSIRWSCFDEQLHGPFPLHQEVEQLKVSGLIEVKTQVRMNMMVYVRTDQPCRSDPRYFRIDPEPKCVALPASVYDSILKSVGEHGAEAFYDPYNGFDFLVTRTGQGINTRYQVGYYQMLLGRTPLDQDQDTLEEALAKCTHLFDRLRPKTREALSEILSFGQDLVSKTHSVAFNHVPYQSLPSKPTSPYGASMQPFGYSPPVAPVPQSLPASTSVAPSPHQHAAPAPPPPPPHQYAVPAPPPYQHAAPAPPPPPHQQTAPLVPPVPNQAGPGLDARGEALPPPPNKSLPNDGIPF